jgi:hypothetical protein
LTSIFVIGADRALPENGNEEYFAATRMIHSELAEIAEATGRMAHLGAANEGNNQFMQLMAKHSASVNQFQQVHAQYLTVNPHFIF